MYIREIRNPLYFQDLCQQLLAAEYPDSVIVDDSRGDRGIDVYIPSIETLFAIYCPRKDSTEKETKQRKIREDIEKAAQLPKREYSIKTFAFLTPTPLTEDIYRYLVNCAGEFGFEFAQNPSEKHLISLFVKYPELEKQFPDLIMPDLMKRIGETERRIISQITVELLELPSLIASYVKPQTDVNDKSDLSPCLKKYRDNLEKRVSETFLSAVAPNVSFGFSGGLENVFVFPTVVQTRKETDIITDYQQSSGSYSTDAENINQSKQSSEPSHPFTLEKLLERGKHFAVNATPGAGKTTLLRYLALQTLMENIRLPIYIEIKLLKDIDLRDISNGLSEVLFRHAFQNNGELHFTTSELEGLRDLFTGELLAGNVAVFLDGLDEADDGEIFDNFANLLEGFARSDFNQNTVFISARPYALAQTSLEGFIELKIMPFDERQIYQFLNLYFGKTGPIRKTKLLLKQHRHLMEMARTPLLLKMIANLTGSGRELGDSRLDLYRTLTNDLVRKIDSAKRIRRFAFQMHDPNGSKKLHFLRIIAFESLFGGKSGIGEVSNQSANRFLLTDEMLREKAVAFINDKSSKGIDPLALADDIKITPLLYEVKNGVYAFTHSIIQEYLAAEVLKTRADCDEIITRAYFDSMLVEREVLPMTLGLLDDPAPIFQTIKKLPESLTFTNVRLRARTLGYNSRISDSEISELLKVLLTAVKIERASESAFLKFIAPSFSVDDVQVSRSLVMKLIKIAVEAAGGGLETRAIEAIKLIGTSDSLSFAANAILAAPTRFMKADAIDILGEFSTQEHIKKLLLHLDDDNDPYLSERAALALCRLVLRSETNPDEIVERILLRLNDITDDPSAIYNLAKALGSIIKDKHINYIAHLIDKKQTANEWALITALGFSRNELARLPLERAIRRKSLAFYAIDALGFLGLDSAVECLIRILRKDNQITSARAALALGRIKAQSALHHLIKGLESKNEDTRMFSAYALGKIGDNRAASPLVSLVKSEPSSVIQAYAIKALGELKTTDATELIATFLQNRDGSLRTAAVEAIGELKQEKILKLHLPVLLKDSPIIKTKLAETLGKIATPASIEPLFTLLDDDNSDIREIAAQVLSNIRQADLAEGILMSLSSLDSRTVKSALKCFCYYHSNPKLVEDLLIIARKNEDAEIRTIASDTAINYLKKLALFDQK